MKIERIRLRNYRRFEDASFCFHPGFTVVIGNNGFGKTTILDALAVLLGTYLQKASIKTGRPHIKRDDHRCLLFEQNDLVTAEPQRPVFLEGEGRLNGSAVQWRRIPRDRGGQARELIDLANIGFEEMRAGRDYDLPVLAYYGVGRLWAKHRKVRTGKPESRGAGYRHCMDPKSDHHLFEKWFKQLEISAIQKRRPIEALEAVRRVVTKCIPGAGDFFFDTARDELMVVIDDSHQRFDQLSDGFKNMIAIVADIAHRALRLNPHLDSGNLARVSGVVLIDEIDQHLHPIWQRRVVADFKAVFPNIQIIATTHSPFIIQALEPGEVLDLGQIGEVIQPIDFQGVATPGPGAAYSHRSIEDIVEDIMGVEMPQRSKRYQEMYRAAREYYQTLEEAEQSNGHELERLERRLDELSAPFSENVAYHAYLKMMRTGVLGRNDGKAR